MALEVDAHRVRHLAAQRRTVAVLGTAQVIGGVGAGAAISVGALLVEEVSGSAAWSGMAATLTTLGAALSAVPLARLADRRGRRVALVTGWLLSTTGSVTTVLAARSSVLPLLLLGLMLMGSGTAATLQARFAATDLAGSHDRARALGLVVWASTVGAVAGPNLSRPGASVAGLVGVPELAGPLLFSAVAALASAVILAVALRPDPLLLARTRHDLGGPPAKIVPGAAPGTGTEVVPGAVPGIRAEVVPGTVPGTGAGIAPAAVGDAPAGVPAVPVQVSGRRVIVDSPDARAGLLALVTGHAAMVAVMAMTPVNMHGHGADLTVIGITISLHIAGMFALSPVVGMVADRAGRRTALTIGAVLLLAATLCTATAGHSVTRVTAGLIALGVGWSFATIAGSTQLSESVPARDRPRTQGTADLVMNLAGATAGAVSGLAVALIGYAGLSLVAAGVVVIGFGFVLAGPASSDGRPESGRAA